MTFAGHSAFTASGALRGTGTSVTFGFKNGWRHRASPFARYLSALLIVHRLPALIFPQILRDFSESSLLPRGE